MFPIIQHIKGDGLVGFAVDAKQEEIGGKVIHASLEYFLISQSFKISNGKMLSLKQRP